MKNKKKSIFQNIFVENFLMEFDQTKLEKIMLKLLLILSRAQKILDPKTNRSFRYLSRCC